MYFVSISADPTAANPDKEIYRECMACCWIKTEDIVSAISRAKTLLEADGEWQTQRVEVAEYVTADSYEPGEEHCQYYQQALIDEEVLCLNICPPFPVYYVKLSLLDDDEADVVHAFVSNDCLDTEHDRFAEDFWADDRIDAVMDLVFGVLAENDLKVVSGEPPIEQKPIWLDAFDGRAEEYFNDAEEDGLCLVVGELFDQSP